MNLVQEQEIKEISSKTNLVIVNIGKNIKTPTIFEGVFSTFIKDINNYDREIYNIDLCLKRIIKHYPNVLLNLVRNLM